MRDTRTIPTRVGRTVPNPEPIQRQRTIPTRVGRTRWRVRCREADLDHPHACGENIASLPVRTDHPHACGENLIRDALLGRPSTVWGDPRGAFLFPDHPHACGENKSALYESGSTFARPWRGAADHPHACGGRTESYSIGVWGEQNLFHRQMRPPGPSPRVWGEPDYQPLCPQVDWTIPHACGENRNNRKLGSQDDICLGLGPSPRVWGEQLAGRRSTWGELFHNQGLVEGMRTIPTRVGRTLGRTLK